MNEAVEVGSTAKRLDEKIPGEANGSSKEKLRVVFQCRGQIGFCEN